MEAEVGEEPPGLVQGTQLERREIHVHVNVDPEKLEASQDSLRKAVDARLLHPELRVFVRSRSCESVDDLLRRRRPHAVDAVVIARAGAQALRVRTVGLRRGLDRGSAEHDHQELPGSCVAFPIVSDADCRYF